MRSVPTRAAVTLTFSAILPSLAFARSGDTTDNPFLMALGMGFLLLLLIGAIANAANDKAKSPLPSPEELEKVKAEAKAFFGNLTADGRISLPSVPINLEKGERAILHEPSSLFETRSVRVYSNRYHTGLKHLDTGTLTLTDRRLVFKGSAQNRIMKLKDVLAVDPLHDGIGISLQRRRKPQVFSVKNSLIWSQLTAMLIDGRAKLQ